METDLVPATCSLLADLLTPSTSPNQPSPSGPLSLSERSSPQLSPIPSQAIESDHTPSESDSDVPSQVETEHGDSTTLTEVC